MRSAAGTAKPHWPTRRIAALRDRLDALGRLSASLNPDRLLDRGYVRVTAGDGRTLVSRAAAQRESALDLHFRDGLLRVSPADAAPDRAPARARGGPKPAPPEQGKLL